MKQLLLIIIIFLSQINLFSQNPSKLELNFKEGDIFSTEYKLASSSFQEVNGEQQIVKKEISYSLLFKVLKAISDSTFYFKTSYERIRYMFDIQGNVSIIDSDSLDIKNISSQDSFLLNIGKGFNFEINKKGKVILIDSISLQNFGSISEDLIKKVKDKSLLNNIFPKLPNKLLQKNDFWVSSDTIKGDIVNVFNKKYLYLENLKNTYKIKEFADIRSNEKKYHKVKSYYVYYKLKGSHIGLATLYKKTGIVENAKITETSFGTAEIKYSKDGHSIYSWPMKIENHISVKTIKIK